MKGFEILKKIKLTKMRNLKSLKIIDILDNSKNDINIISKSKDIIEVKDKLFNIESLNNLKFISYNNTYFILAPKTQ